MTNLSVKPSFTGTLNFVKYPCAESNQIIRTCFLPEEKCMTKTDFLASLPEGARENFQQGLEKLQSLADNTGVNIWIGKVGDKITAIKQGAEKHFGFLFKDAAPEVAADKFEKAVTTMEGDIVINNPVSEVHHITKKEMAPTKTISKEQPDAQSKESTTGALRTNSNKIEQFSTYDFFDPKGC